MQRIGHSIATRLNRNIFTKNASNAGDLGAARSGPWGLSAIITNTLLFGSARTCTSGVKPDGSVHATISQDDEACAALYFFGTAPADILGAVTVRDIPGKGRGLVAQQDLRLGDIVMAVQPVAVLHGPQDAMPSPDSLAEHLEASWVALSPQHKAAIRQMFVGPTASITTDRQSSATGPPAQVSGAVAEAATGSGSSSGEVDFRAVVSYNAYGDEYEDLPAADLRGGSPPQSHVGLWPHFSNLNHACAPNCVHYVVGSTMIVRAVQGIPAGSELLISYLGREDLAPRQVRQAALRSRYGFACDCARCRTEAELPEELQSLLQQLYDRSRHELAPRFERLAAAASAAAEGLDGGGGVGLYDDEEYDDGPLDGTEADVAGAGSGIAAAGGDARSSGPSLTAAELAKRALRKQQQGQQGASSPTPGPQWPGPQLASLEPRLEECARELHTAVQELQEDDEAVADAPEGAALPGTAGGEGSGGGGRHLTRVQAAQAAAYQLLELLHLHAELTAAAATGAGSAGGAGRARAAAAGALQACWHVLDAISRGSELQVFQACKLLNDALQAAGYSNVTKRGANQQQQQQPPPEPVREAAALLGQSLTARYGRLRGQQLTRVTQAAIRASRGFF